MIHCFFVISHDRRRILHCNVTGHPTSAWVTQQLREAFPYNPTEKYLIFDRAANFNEEVVSTIKSFGIEPKRTCFRSPWQNGVAEEFWRGPISVSRGHCKASQGLIKYLLEGTRLGIIGAIF
jgi:hypothetical protein